MTLVYKPRAALQVDRPPDAANEERPTAPTVDLSGNSKADAPIVAGAAKSGKPPVELQALPAWLIWRLEDVDGVSRKVPYYAQGGKRLGRQGDASDVRQLVTFDAAQRAAEARGFTGVGFATLPQFGVSALDFDACCVDGVVDPAVLACVAGTYAELSPSGTGVRAFVTGSFGANRKSHANATQFGVEVFSTKGFVTVTGNALPSSVDAVNERTAALTTLYAQRFGDGTASATSEPIGMSVEQIKACLAALDADRGYNDWLQAGMAAHFETQGAIEALDAWDDWSSGGAKYPGRDALESRWDGFGRSDGAQVTGGTLLKMARAAGLEVGQVAAPSDFTSLPPSDESSSAPARQPVALDWLAMPDEPPEPHFIIPGWMPDGVVTLFAAHGGTGKSYMSLYIALCLATGRHPFVEGETIEQVRVLLYSAEDNMIVMQSRLSRYLRVMGLRGADLAGWLQVLDATECNNVLFAGDEKLNGRTTPRFAWLADQVKAFGATVLIFDNASDAMDANENDRAKVRQFMSALKRIASAVLLLAHVDAASSMADAGEAKGYSGSTGWHNSARSRWFMARVKDSDDIVLTLPKVNYAKAGSEAVIQWDDAHRLFQVRSVREGRAKAANFELVLLGLLERAVDSGRRVSPSSNTPASVFNTLKDMDGFPSGLKSRDVAKLVTAWIERGMVEEVPYVRSNRTNGTCVGLTAAGRAVALGAAGQGLEELL